jgi:2,4-diaminopentanoate dehydrogenase
MHHGTLPPGPAGAKFPPSLPHRFHLTGQQGDEAMIRVIQLGLGPLGRQIVRYICERRGLELVGVVDVDPGLQGRDAGEVCGIAPLGLRVAASLDEARLHAAEVPQVAVLATVSSIEKLVPQVAAAARAGLHSVSTCEELSFPWRRHRAAAEAIDAVCREHRVACLGTGVNPGYLMDYLPAVFTAIAQRVDRIEVERVQDASRRRVPFQQKIGAGLTPAEFEAQRRAGTLRHVGLPESVDMIAQALGWELESTAETLEPVLAEEDIGSGYRAIARGQPAGVQQIATGMLGGREVLRLTFRAAVGEERSYDRIRIRGLPDVDTTVDGGINGDVATCAITVNAIRAVLRAEPGLRTMLDTPVPAWFADGPAARAEVAAG